MKETNQPNKNGTVSFNNRIKKSVADLIDKNYQELVDYCKAHSIDIVPTKGMYLAVVIRESPVLDLIPEEILNKIK